jgi:inosine/xanthosine triphosphate pyrophosphatase family protein
MALWFITGNKDKLREVQALIPDVQSIDLDLPEIPTGCVYDLSTSSEALFPKIV